MPPLFVVLCTSKGTTKIWSTEARSFSDAVRVAEEAARQNPDKEWSAITYGPSGLPVIFRAKASA